MPFDKDFSAHYMHDDVTVAPYLKARDIKAGVTPAQLIDMFEDRFTTWVFDFVDLLKSGKQIERVSKKVREKIRIDSGYVVLQILSAYVEVIGQLTGESFPLEPDDGVVSGVKEIFPSLSDRRMNVPKKYAHFVRNPVSHVMLPRTVSLGPTLSGEPIDWGYVQVTVGHGDAIKIKQQLMFRVDTDRYAAHLRQHFKSYCARIRNPATELDRTQRTRFLERYRKLQQVKGDAP